MWYKLDWKKLTALYLPIVLRQKYLIAFFYTLIELVEQMHYEFLDKREDTLYKIKHNGQVCHLRKVLNDRFDRALRRIKILDGNKYGRHYIYTDGELKPKYLGKIYVRPDSDYADTGVDFIVLMPKETYKQYEVESNIDYYKLASKRYKIELT